MPKQFISRKLLPSLARSILALIGLGGSSQVASAQAHVYVSNNGDNTVSEIDTSTNTVVATIRVGSGPEGMAITPDGTRLYVANDSGSVWVLDTSNNTVAPK
jgi:YVTN family beta-propeller protein